MKISGLMALQYMLSKGCSVSAEFTDAYTLKVNFTKGSFKYRFSVNGKTLDEASREALAVYEQCTL